MQGIPPQLRAIAWMELSGANSRMQQADPEYFRTCLKSLADRPDHPIVKQVDLDIARTFPEHPYFHTSLGCAKLRAVLLAYAGHNPAVGYCQSMNYVTGFLLLVLDRDAEHAFWALMALIEGALSQREPSFGKTTPSIHLGRSSHGDWS